MFVRSRIKINKVCVGAYFAAHVMSRPVTLCFLPPPVLSSALPSPLTSDPPWASVSIWPTLHLNVSQEGHLCSHQHALWDSGSVPRGRDVSATSQLQHQWGHRPPVGLHCSSWAGTQVRFYGTHTNIPSNADDSTCFTLISSAKCSQIPIKVQFNWQ